MFYRRLLGFPTWGVRRSFGELDRMRQMMDNLYDSLSQGEAPLSKAGVFPLVNLTEDADKYFIRAELPGVASEDLDIQATGKGISISGERKIFAEDESAKYHRRERDAGTFSRMVSLPGDIDVENVNARLADGILTIDVPKAEAAKPRQIAIS